MAKKQLSAANALKRLKEGNKRFSTDCPIYERHDADTRATMPGGQDPFAIILSCADSRVIPELIFDVGLSELFVVRVAGNVANTCSIASIEYAVAHLNVNLVVVLGHEGCGAVDAALAGGDNGYNLNHLLAHLQPAVAKPSGKRPRGEIAKRGSEECETYRQAASRTLIHPVEEIVAYRARVLQPRVGQSQLSLDQTTDAISSGNPSVRLCPAQAT